jgi:general secretion pathway protein C
MDVAKPLTQWREQSAEEWLQWANRFLPTLVVALLVLAIAYKLAELTWAVTPHQSFDRSAPVIVQPQTGQNTSRSQANFSALMDSHLFGRAPAESEAPAAPVSTELEAPDTSLSIRLTGVVADENGKLSQAIIASGRGQERKYAISQEIENTNGTTLHAVYADRIILNRGGQLETLRLPREPSTASGRVAPPPPPPPPAAAAPLESTSLRDVAASNATQLSEIMRMAPHLEGGQMIGFRVNPGRQRQAFEALGLMPNDIVTDVNGMVLDDPSRALQVFESLGESSQAAVTVLRDGVPNVLMLDTTQLQSIADDRQ